MLDTLPKLILLRLKVKPRSRGAEDPDVQGSVQVRPNAFVLRVALKRFRTLLAAIA